MKSILNQNLLKALITSDFLLETSKLSHVSRYQNLTINSPFRKHSYVFSDPLETVKDLKQIVRILNFLKRTSYKEDWPILDFFFSVNDNLTSFELLIPKILQRLDWFNLNPHLNALAFNNPKPSLAIILSNLQNFEGDLTKKRVNKKCYLFLKTNSGADEFFGEYKVRHSLNEFKKTIFFLTFLRQALLKRPLN